MRSFVSAACCLIVGLEILIGVPVAVCLGFLALGSSVEPGVYVSEAQFAIPTCPPPIYSNPPLPSSPGSYAPTSGPMPTATTYCPAPMAPAIVAALPASDPAADRPSPVAPAVNAPAAIDEPQFLARVCADVSCPSTSSNAPVNSQTSSPEKTLAESLHVTALLLYQQAERHEADQEYNLADRLRSLARDLRDEAGSISRRMPVAEPAAVEPPTPANVEEHRTVTVGPPPRG